MNDRNQPVDPEKPVGEPLILLVDDDDAGFEPAVESGRRVSICSQNVTDD